MGSGSMRIHMSMMTSDDSICKAIGAKLVSIEEIAQLQLDVLPFFVEADEVRAKDPAQYQKELEESLARHNEILTKQNEIWEKIQDPSYHRTVMADRMQKTRQIQEHQKNSADYRVLQTEQKAGIACDDNSLGVKYSAIREIVLVDGPDLFKQQIKEIDQVLQSNATSCYKRGKLKVFIDIYEKVQSELKKAKDRQDETRRIVGGSQ